MVQNGKESIHIIYLGGCWPTNIGNSFIDLGSLYSLKKACPNGVVHFVSDISGSEFMRHTGSLSNSFMLTSKIQADYLVFSGMVLNKQFISINGEEIFKLINNNKNIKIIISGGGGMTYSEEEVSVVEEFLYRLDPYLFISRDSTAFKYYKNCSNYSHDGIDCGFFVSDCFMPAKLFHSEFIVANFDDSTYNENDMPLHNNTMIIRTHHAIYNELLPNKLIPIYDKLISRYTGIHYYDQPNTLISDNPNDYLNLYANAKSTYSTRVHACVATLAFGGAAMLFSETPRALLFDKVGASRIKEKLTYADMQKMSNEKSEVIKLLSKAIEEI